MKQNPIELNLPNVLALAKDAARERLIPAFLRTISLAPAAVFTSWLAEQATLLLSNQIAEEMPDLIKNTPLNTPARTALLNLQTIADNTQAQLTVIPGKETVPEYDKGLLSMALGLFALYANTIRFPDQTTQDHPRTAMRVFATIHNALHERQPGKKLHNFIVTSIESLNVALVHTLPYTVELANALNEVLPHTDLNPLIPGILGTLPWIALGLDTAVVYSSITQWGHYFEGMPVFSSTDLPPQIEKKSDPNFLQKIIHSLKELPARKAPTPRIGAGTRRMPHRRTYLPKENDTPYKKVAMPPLPRDLPPQKRLPTPKDDK